MRHLVCIAALLALSACATSSQISALSVGGEPTVTSIKQASLSHVPGTVISDVRALGFSARDQSELIEVLRRELLRLKVFQAAVTGGTAERLDFKITVTFAETRYYLLGWGGHLYTLNVAMRIEGGKIPFQKAYWVNSNESLSDWQRFTMNAHETKEEAALRLLEKLVPDIQTYVAGNT